MHIHKINCPHCTRRKMAGEEPSIVPHRVEPQRQAFFVNNFKVGDCHQLPPHTKLIEGVDVSTCVDPCVGFSVCRNELHHLDCPRRGHELLN